MNINKIIQKLSNINRSRIGEFFSEADVMNADRPRSVGCETTNICNANCSFCGYGKGDDGKAADPRDKSKLNEEVFHHTLKLYSDAGGGVFNLGPILGENTVNPKWLDYIKEARKYPAITGVSSYTNGILLERFGYHDILTSGLTLLNISTCLSGPERYKQVYGVDKYKEVVENILGLLKENHKLGSPVTIFLLLRIDKPFSIFFETELYRNITEYLPVSHISIQEDDWDDFRGLIKIDGIPVGNSFKNNLPLSEKKNPCYALYRKLQVLQNGTIQGCSCRVEPELWCGNIKDYSTLQDAWKDEKLEKIRSDWKQGVLPNCCVECTHYQSYTNLISRRPKNALVYLMFRIVQKAKRLFVKEKAVNHQHIPLFND